MLLSGFDCVSKPSLQITRKDELKNGFWKLKTSVRFKILSHLWKYCVLQFMNYGLRHGRGLLIICILLITTTLPSVAQFDINHYLREGYADLNKSNYTSAINRFNTIIQVKPEMLEPYYFRGFCKYRLDDYQGAYLDFKRVIELNPYFADGYRMRGVIKALQQDYQDAMEDFAKALELDPANANIYTSRSYTYMSMKNYDLAIADVNEALKINKDEASSYFLRG